jgi:hypothetical protein
MQWIPICDTAIKKSAYAASREHYSVTQDGKKLYPSPKYIKQKIPQILQFILLYSKYVPYYDKFVNSLYEIADKHPQLELRQEIKRLELKYLREQIPRLLQLWNKTLMQVQGDTKGTFEKHNHNSNSNNDNDKNKVECYEYFETRYHDKTLYEKQKLEWKEGKRRAKPDGWKTCCIFSTAKMNPNEVELLQKEVSPNNDE